MTTTFSDYCATADAREQIAANVLEWTQMLCLALEQDFVQDSIRRANFFNNTDPEYKAKRLASIERGDCLYKFYHETGRKYYKIIMETENGSRSVHAFVNKKTGELHKAASFKAPVKEPRFDLRIITEREFVLEKCDWSGGYLYKNAYYQG
tara:strand:+ start:71 stop:523 length:453 start_codon:yes stop_codon:yes gene_type:complete